MENLIENVLDAIPSMRILVVGDVMLDQFMTGEILRMSPEAPAPVFTVSSETEMLGGAANAARAAAALDASAAVVGVVGRDGWADRVRSLLAEVGVADGLVAADDRPTTRKTRFVSAHDNAHLLRADWESTRPIQEEAAEGVLFAANRLLADSDVILISDYGKGVLSEPVLQEIFEQASTANIPVIVDPKGDDYSKYRGATYVTPNLDELEKAVGRTIRQDPDDIAAAAEEILEITDARAVIVKRGADGLQFLDRATTFHMPSVAAAVVDVSGAGDTLTTTFALCVATGASLPVSLRIANAAAGTVVGKKGTAFVTFAEMLDAPSLRASAERTKDRTTVLQGARR